MGRDSKEGVLLMKKVFYVTTAIAYPNAKPHLGHALEIIQADVVARFHRLKGEEVFFQTGTDEHGLKNWQSAQERGVSLKEFLDENVAAFRDLYEKLLVSYDQFIRTTDEKVHHPGAVKLWRELVKAGDIYKREYRGLYCAGCESFKLARELVGGKCPDHPTREVALVEEENYFFRLSKYKEEVARRIERDEYRIIPAQRKKEILSFLKEARDISFSRPRTSLPWGIPVPGDEEHVMYVWCDALSNYITGAGYGRDEELFARRWPADCHIIGKDILRFHAAFWPAMLLSARLPLPRQLFVHGFILARGGAKMSKSTGNVIDPFEQIAAYGADQFRFYLLEAMPLDGDGEYDEEVFRERINTELVGNLANFCYRTLSFIKRNYQGMLSRPAGGERAKRLEAAVAERRERVIAAYEGCEFRKALQELLHIAQLGNAYLQEAAPWKDPAGSQDVLTTCANIVKELSILLSPVTPGFAAALQEQLKLREQRLDALSFTLEGHEIGTPAILWRRAREERSGGRASSPARGVGSGASSSQEEKDRPAEHRAILDLVVARITRVERHPNAEKLYVEHLDLGGEDRVIVSGLVPYYAPEELLGKHVILVRNLKPARLRGVLSEGMLLAAEEKGVVEVLDAGSAPPGTRVVVRGEEVARPERMITIEEFSRVPLLVRDGRVYCGGELLLVAGREVQTSRVKNGAVR